MLKRYLFFLHLSPLQNPPTFAVHSSWEFRMMILSPQKGLLV